MRFFDSFLFRDITNLFLGSVPLMAASGLIYWFVRRTVHKKRFGADFKEVRRRSRLNEIIGLLLVIWTALVVGSTLDPKWGFFINLLYLPPHWQVIPEIFIHKRIDVSHSMLNMLMFVPIGLVLPFAFIKDFSSANGSEILNRTARNRFKKTLTEFGLTVFAGFYFTFNIEFLQGFSGQRSGDINDVINNTLGTVAGYLLYLLIKAILPRFAALCKTSADDVYSEIHE